MVSRDATRRESNHGKVLRHTLLRSVAQDEGIIYHVLTLSLSKGDKPLRGCSG